MSPAGWSVRRISDVADVIGGSTPATRNPALWDGNIPWITPRDLSGYSSRMIGGGERYLSPAGLRAIGGRLLPPNAVLLTTRAPIGYVALADRPVATNQGFRSLVAKEGVAPEFLYYLLKANTELLKARASGSTFPELSGSALGVLEFPFPPIQEQRAIASILGALDDKIELNRRMGQTLEALTRAIFQSWFIDFDPVRAKAGGREPAGMDAETAALFPSSFDDSPLGPIPSGWQIIPLDRLATFLNGLALQRYPPSGDNDLPAIKIPELRSGVTTTTGRASSEVPGQYVVRDGDVLFSWSGSLMAVIWSGGPGALNQHLFRVISDHFPRWLYYLWIQEHMPSFRQIAAGKATTMGHIQRSHLSQALCLVPSGDVLERATAAIEPLLQFATSRSIEGRKLAELRDTLLPKLISGELRVLDRDSASSRTG